MSDTHYSLDTEYDFDSLEYEGPNGTMYDVTEIEYEDPNGTMYDVWHDEIPIDVFERSSLGYYVGDTGQATQPQISSGDGYDNDNALWCPSGNPNDVTNLSSNNPAYESGTQGTVLDNYLETGDIAEIYFRPTNWGSGYQFRFSFFTFDYYGVDDHIRLRFTDGYWRIEQGTSLYGGSGTAEDYTGFNSNGNWHRVVVDASSFPYIECHLWDAGTGNFLGTVSGDGNGNPDVSGHYFWWNNTTEMYVSDYRKIDDDDFNAGSDL